MDVYEMPVQPGNFSHIFNGISPASFYYYKYSICYNNDCSYLSDDTLNTRFEGVKLNQTTDITQTSALVNWELLRNGDTKISYVWVYAIPVDKSLDQQRCVGTSRQECTLEHLRPDSDYDLVVKACENIGFCTALKPQGRIRTLKPYTLEPPSDIKSANVWPTSFSLIWSKPVADIADSFEYRVSLTATEDPTTPMWIFICETSLERDGTVICPVRNLQTDFSYSATVSTCVRADMCSQPSATITVKTGQNDNYVLNATAIGPYSATLSWSSTRTKPDSEFRVDVDFSPIPSCTTAVTEGPQVCHLQGLLPSTKYACQLLECLSNTAVCVTMFSFTLSTTTDEQVQKVLRTLAADMTKASAKPLDTTGQLMIRVSYAELGIPDMGNLQGVSVVITPLQDQNMLQSPAWSSASDKKLQFVGGVSKAIVFINRTVG
ncbi:unnamed protein product [Dibothriocephalus latus]|uniref:Fibronectin type-III domain-containing protein n=1 Tax=Dibothriocephalus latus TaxID=60516 RepID=A0A3P7NYK4_DIBLA|nr:unnamed protein product [Dibothriocephalus latus]